MLPNTIPIAIIGISGRYPQANNLAQYWENLKSGKDCIGEIPKDRWDWQEYFEEDSNKAAMLGKSYSKWSDMVYQRTGVQAYCCTIGLVLARSALCHV